MVKFNQLMFCALAALISLAGCSKKDALPSSDRQEALQTANRWLESRTVAGETERNKRVETLRKHLDISGAFTETAADGEKITIIPLNAAFKMNYNHDKRADHYLLLFESKKRGLYKGNIVQFIPEKENERTLPPNTLSKLWDAEDLSVNGSFTFLTIFDRLLYTVDFKDGRKMKFSEVREGRKKPGAPSAEAISCYEFYLVTTTYYTDGTSETTETFLGSACYTYCIPGEACSVKDDSSPGGPGGGGGDPEVQVTESKEWLVYTLPSDGSWRVYSTERFKAKKGGGIPDGGKFISVTHRYTTSPSPELSIHYWTPGLITNTVIEDGAKATCDVTGRIWTVISDTTISRSKTFTVAEVFP